MTGMISILLLSTLRMGTPLALTALGGTMSERSGVTNIGLEGILTAGAFAAVVGSYFTGNPWIGVLCAIIMGIAISAIHSFIAVTAGGAQNISAMALVMLANGFSAVGLNAIFKSAGNSAQVNALPTTPILAHIPVVGEFLAKLSPFVYIAFIMLFVVWYIFKHTPLGLRITMVGEQPKAAETAGISVAKIRYFSVLASGFLGGLGGAYLSLGQMNLYQDGMVSGRGYLALGAVIMGKWNPVGAFFSAMFFGLFEAIQIYVQMIPNFPVPHEFIEMIPYVASLIVLAGFIGKAEGPAANGKPYSRFVNLR